MPISAWSDNDDARLRRELERAEGKISWSELAKLAFPDGRFNKNDCQTRWNLISKPKPSRGPWTKEEDTRLEGLVATYGSEKWVVIANEMLTRTGKQCRERWHNHLDPTINKGEWTAAEDELIHTLYSKIGSRWAEISKHLPGRPDNAIKNYYNASLVRQKRRRGGSISSLTSALDISGGAETSTGMTRSASSNSLSKARFTPYRSTPMTKSRSDSISSPPNLYSPYHESTDPFGMGSSTGSPPSFTSPYATPAMSRSQSYNMTSSTSHGATQPLNLIARDLTKDMDPYLHHSSRDTPPATPDRSPFPSNHPSMISLEYPFLIAPLSPPSSASASFQGHATYDSGVQAWHEGAVSSNRPFGGYDAVKPLEDLHIGEYPSATTSQFEPYPTVDEEKPSTFYPSPYSAQNQEFIDRSLARSQHGHSYSLDSAVASDHSIVQQQMHQHQHRHQHYHHQSHHSFSSLHSVHEPTSSPHSNHYYSNSNDTVPYVHPSHQLDMSQYESASYATSHDPARLSPVVDEFFTTPEDSLPPHQLHSVAPSQLASPAYVDSTPSYDQIAAATGIYSNVLTSEAKPFLRRQESQISTSSLTSAGSVFPSPSSVYAQISGSASSSEPSPHAFTFPVLAQPVPEEVEDVKPSLETIAGAQQQPEAIIQERHAAVAPAPVSVPRYVGFVSSSSMCRANTTAPTSSLAAPINLDDSGFAEFVDAKQVLSQSTSGRISPALVPVPMRRIKTLDGLRIRTDGADFGNFMSSSPRSARTMGMASPSWATRHPTSDLMGADKHGRACLPGM